MRRGIQLTTDVERIKQISGEDLLPGNRVGFALLSDDNTAGIITFELLNSVMWSPHIIIYKQYRGPGSEEWGKLALIYMVQHLGAKKFLAFTPYIPAKKYAERLGFEQIGVLKQSIEKNGTLMDQYMLELGVKE